MGSVRVGHDLATDKQHRQGMIAPFFSIGILSFLNDLVFSTPILQVIQLLLNSFFFFLLRFSRESLLPKAIDFYNQQQMINNSSPI